MKNFRIVVQARMNSSRLPGKMSKSFFDGKGLLQIVLERLTESFLPELIVLATTTERSDDNLIKVADICGVNHYRGDETDVLQRFIEVGSAYGCDYLIRVCADNPFILPNLISKLNDSNIEGENLDYIGYSLNDGTPVIKSHLGLAAELVSLKALIRVGELTSEPVYHEHVTNFIYSNPSLFNIKWLPMTKTVTNRKDLRFTVDTLADFKLMKQLYAQVSGTKDLVELVNAVDLAPSYIETMISQIKGNKK